MVFWQEPGPGRQFFPKLSHDADCGALWKVQLYSFGCGGRNNFTQPTFKHSVYIWVFMLFGRWAFTGAFPQLGGASASMIEPVLGNYYLHRYAPRILKPRVPSGNTPLPNSSGASFSVTAQVGPEARAKASKDERALALVCPTKRT